MWVDLRRIARTMVSFSLLVLLPACEKDRDMAEVMEMPDSTHLMKVMQDDEMRDSVLDVMPGGEMVRGDSTASETLLRSKMGNFPP